MMPIVLALLALSSLFGVIYAKQITCAADPSNLFFNIQCDHTTTERYGGTTFYDICWVKILDCDEGDDTEINHPLNTSYVEAIAPYAISAKIVPADLADPHFDDYAVYAKVCENPVISLNNLLELSNTIDVTTLTRIGPSDLTDWYGLNGAPFRLQQDAYCHCPESEQLLTSPFHPCSGHEKQLQISTKQTSNGAVDVCQWDRHWRDNSGQCRNKEIALYFGFDANKESMCDGGGHGGLQSVFGQHTQRRRSRRRLPYVNGTYSGPNAPCLTLQIALETENLLPSNNEPDSAANIYLVGQALGGGSNGNIVMPDIIDPELDDEANIDDEYVWDVDAECMDETQIQDSYFQSDTVSPDLIGNVTVVPDGFSLTVPYETPESILYQFEISALPFTIWHSCLNAIGFFAEIYEDGELLGESELISIPPNEAGVDRQKSLLFNESVLLNPNTSFEIIFSGIYYNGDGNDCELSNISVGNGDNRRRLVDDDGYFDYADFEASANPNSCILGAGLAKSASMKTAVSAMCNDGLPNFEEIETGFFRQHGSNALANHVVMSGSLEVYDENGELKFQTNGWPANDIKNPCIAIDELNLRVYAIGGYSATTGLAVADIQVFRFDNDSLLNGGPVTDLLGWQLDKKRYGSMCLFWRKDDDDSEHLIVVSGMLDPADELLNKKKFFNDIRVFPVPADGDQLNNEWDGQTSSEPSSGNSYLGKPGLLDSRLLLFENHYLYFFGGKTHVASKQFVQLFDLNEISLAVKGAVFSLETMSLTQDKALPVVDITALTDGIVTRTCYMIFAGQSYAENAAVGDGVSRDNLQLFCNPLMGDVSQPVSVSRRLGEAEDVVTLSEFDKYMFQKGKTQRRLVTGTGEEESEVLIRDYDYRLDGIWYDFDVTVNLCYANNSELEEAEIYYTDVDMAGIAEDILTKSEEAYLGWSIGFGAVNVFDLDIVAVNYATSDPTTEPTSEPTTDPTADPTSDPTTDPTADPTTDPTADPTTDPTADPTTSTPTTSAPTTSEPTTSAPTTVEPTTSDCGCISSCAGVPDGDYPSCNSCHTYATCANGILYDDRPCAATTPPLVWNDNLKSCATESSCSEDPCGP